MKITQENYYEVKTHISYHDILDYRKCGFLYEESRKGKVARIQRDYFLYGNALDSFLTGDFDKRFIIGADPKKTADKLAKEREKATETLKKYSGKEDKRSQMFAEKAEKMIAEIRLRETEIEGDMGKEAITETIGDHIKASVAELDRQTLMSRFPRNEKTNQTILVTELNGIKVKGKLDYFHLENGIIADYKTTAGMVKFNPMAYRDQLAWYRMLARQVHGKDFECYLIVVDKDAHVKHSYFYQFAPETLDAAEPDLISTMERMSEDIESGLFEPAAFRDIKTCFTCDHYGNCPFTVQREPELI